MWLFMLETDRGEEPILLEEREAPEIAAWGWRRVAEVSSRDEVYALLPGAGVPPRRCSG